MHTSSAICKFLSIAFSILASWTVLPGAELTPQLLSEIGNLWPKATGLSDISTEEEQRTFDVAWERIEEIGEETMSKGLVELYKQKAGVDRPLSLTKTTVPRNDPTFEAFAFEEDSREKGHITLLLARDPRRTEDFLPLIRERYRWMISHVLEDRTPTALDTGEVGSASFYLLARGNAEDSKMVEELKARYLKSSIPFSAERVESIELVIANIENSKDVMNQRGLPFVRRGKAVASKPAGATADPKSITRSPSGTSSTSPQIATPPPMGPIDRSCPWLVAGLLVVTALASAWFLLSKARKR